MGKLRPTSIKVAEDVPADIAPMAGEEGVDFISAFANPLPARVITALIPNGMLALLQNLEQVARLPDDYSFLPSAVEKFPRFQGPVQTVPLIAKENIAMAGVMIRADKKVFFLVVASHRDQLIF